MRRQKAVKIMLSINEQFLYISDIHVDELLWAKFGGYREDDETRDYLIDYCSGMMRDIDESVPIEAILIAGDVGDNVFTMREFIFALRKVCCRPVFYVLGNHEYWMDGTDRFENNPGAVEEIYRKQSVLPSLLLQNQAYIRYGEYGAKVVDYKGLAKLDADDFPDVRYIVYGGTGFSGNNPSMNALSRQYLNTIEDRKLEKRLSKKFLSGLHRLSRAFPDERIIVLSHMPVEDWIDEAMAKKPYIYITGHTHKNERYVTPDGTWVLADNQRPGVKHPKLKSFTVADLDREFQKTIAG